MLVKLVCPHCKVEVRSTETGAACSSCARVFPNKGGVLCFLDQSEAFNEGDFQDQTRRIGPCRPSSGTGFVRAASFRC